VEFIVKTSVEKVASIPPTHVFWPKNESPSTWMVRSQQHPNVIFNLKYPFTKYACCTCKWGKRENLCKHQIALLFTYNDVTKKMVINVKGDMDQIKEVS
jgi:hypothetical protein